MATALSPFPAAAAFAHPAFDPLRPWLAPLLRPEGQWPQIDALNALAGKADPGPANARGMPIRFRHPDPADKAHYEQRIFDTGWVDTRPENLHDLFNALAWLAFPRLKAALNAGHAERLPLEPAGRGRFRDLLTLLDEGGVLVACAADERTEVEALVRGFQWQALFWERRANLLGGTRFVLAGHSAYEKSLSPYPGITCKAVFLSVPRDLLEGPLPALVARLDAQAADWLMTLPDGATPRQMAPLPVFGYPGWLPGSRAPGFYADRRWFRAAPVRKGVGRELEHAA